MLRYIALANVLRIEIEQGRLRAGERIPSIRELALNHCVSTSTAVQACHLLERESLIIAKERRGYFVCAPQLLLKQKVHPPREPCLISNPASRRVSIIEPGVRVLPLHNARPAASLLPDAAMAAALSRCLRQQRDIAMDYAVPQGYGPLRQQIANRYVNLGARVEMEEVIITSGAMEAISLALRTITSPGDLVMVETPSYQGILQTIASLGLRIVDFPQVEAGGLDVEQLEAILSTQPVRAAVVVANFSNPSGRTLNDTAKQSLVSICRRYGTVIVEDDVYGELAWDDSRPSPLRRFNQGDNVITCSSFSKFLAPGLRVGWLLGGARIDELVRVKHFSTIGNPALPQLAISNYLERHKLERGLRKLRRGLAQTARQMRDVIIHGWPQGSRVSQPQGGLSLWIKLPRGADAEKLFGSALSHGIGIAPGSIFSNGDDYADHIRLTCGLPWDAQLEQGLTFLGRLVGEQLKQKS